MTSHERRETIQQRVVERGEVSIHELEVMYPQYSSMTLRRDLQYLENRGVLKRTHGGAIAVTRLSSNEEIYSLREVRNIQAKASIARKAARYVEPGRTVYFDSGTTMMCLASMLENDRYSIITSGPNIALEVGKRSKAAVTIVGGRLSQNTVSVSGMQALECVRNCNIDVALVATSAFSLGTGFTCGSESEAMLKKLVIEKANTVVMLMDSSKLGKNMAYTFAQLKDIDVLIMEEVPADLRKEAEQMGIEVI